MKYNYKSSNRIFNSNVSKNNKAQVSVEYLIIIGVSLAVLIPGTYFFYEYSKSSNEGAIRSQINQIGSSIVSNAESVYGLGEGSLVTTEVRYPKNIRDVYILDDSELVIKYELSSGMNEAVFFSRVPISGNFTYPARGNCVSLPCGDSSIIASSTTEQGSRRLKFESKTNHVLLTVSR